MNIKKQVLDRIAILKSKPKMVFPDTPTYDDIRNYLLGYFHGIDIITDRNLVLEITQWYNTKVNRQFDIYWLDAVSIMGKGESTETLKLALLDATEDFFLQFNNDI